MFFLGHSGNYPSGRRPYPLEIIATTGLEALLLQVEHPHIWNHFMALLIRPRAIVREIDAVPSQLRALPHLDAHRAVLPQEQREFLQILAFVLNPDASLGIVYLQPEHLHPASDALHVERARLPLAIGLYPVLPSVDLQQLPPRQLHQVLGAVVEAQAGGDQGGSGEGSAVQVPSLDPAHGPQRQELPAGRTDGVYPV